MEAPSPVVTFKKGPSRRPQQSRKRTPPPEDDAPSDPSSSSVVRPQKKSLANPLVQGTKRRRDLDDPDAVGGLDEFDYKADEGVLADRADTFATRSADYDLEAGGSTSVDGKRVRLNEDGEIDDGLYHGQKGYLTTINKRSDVLDTKMKTGPIRATANIRTITLVDYQPDVCKPYKETGFCGYGDSCKFLHDRGDYLAGWQLDKMDPAEAKQIMEEEEEEVPFACYICRKEFTDPVVTKCGHYFCMKCAVDRFKKSPKCYVCGAATSGMFNKAEKILAKLEAKNKRIREARGEEEGAESGIQFGGDSDDEGGDGEDHDEE
ncbi:hypothetical protein DB88DRAFT_506234 [Papiliotrema laurentii]|uniref:Pre-mRNA-splicing factor CWC24 n=1 Tax=Papiliotrema laurentii TaxID=5418 RepID=A0AAD9CUA2_PAPLA|nr:hypothetical protein DB88DRAFT_506234 [Papiliotrema laurentii]